MQKFDRSKLSIAWAASTGMVAFASIAARLAGALCLAAFGAITPAFSGCVDPYSAPPSVDVPAWVTITCEGNNATAAAALAFSGNATLSNEGKIVSTGDGSSAAQAHSFFGSATVDNTGNIFTSGAGSPSVNAYSQEGSTVNNAGIIVTTGDSSNGVGAGAAVGAITVNNSGTVTGSGQYSAGINADGTHGYVNSSVMSVINTGSIIETGFGSMGVGISSDAVTSFSNAATGVIKVTGSNSVGVFLGTCAPNGSDCVINPAPHQISLQSSGIIQATGFNNHGIVATNFNSGLITINLGQGSVTQGGTGSKMFGISAGNDTSIFSGSSAILLLGASGTTITNAGTISSGNGQAILVAEGSYTVGAQQLTFVTANTSITNAATGNIAGDITLGSGSNTITNAGAIAGSINVGGGGAVTFNNYAGATYTAGPTINLNGRTLTNAGTLALGTPGAFQTTALFGNYVQTSTGVLAVSINNITGQSGLLAVTGNASLSGAISVSQTGLLAVQPNFSTSCRRPAISASPRISCFRRTPQA